MAQVTARHEAVQFPLPTWTMALCAVSRSAGVGGIVFRLRMKGREDAGSAQRGNDLPKNIERERFPKNGFPQTKAARRDA